MGLYGRTVAQTRNAQPTIKHRLELDNVQLELLGELLAAEELRQLEAVQGGTPPFRLMQVRIIQAKCLEM
jgi:hypothetical protein